MRNIDACTEERRKGTLVHINRIQGQIDALKRLIADHKDCMEIAALTTSIAKSFDALRFRTLEGFLINNILRGKGTDRNKLARLNKLLEFYKK